MKKVPTNMAYGSVVATASENMRRISSFFVTLLRLVALLVMSAAYSFAAPAPVPPTAEPSEQSAPSLAGFKQTVEYWNQLENLAREVESTLVTLDNQATELLPGNNPERLASYNRALAQKYPGARYDGKSGSVPLPNHLVAFFTEDLKISKITDDYSAAGRRSSRNYFVHERKFECSSGFNSIAGLVNKESPGDSMFTMVNFADFQKAAEKIIPSGQEATNAYSSAGVTLLNDAYQLSAGAQRLRMDVFAEKFLSSEDTYNSVLKNAQTGYRERHASTHPEMGSPKPVEKVEFFGKAPLQESLWSIWSFFVVFLLGVLTLFAGLFYGVRWLSRRGGNAVPEKREHAGEKKGPAHKEKSRGRDGFVTILEHEQAKVDGGSPVALSAGEAVVEDAVAQPVAQVMATPAPVGTEPPTPSPEEPATPALPAGKEQTTVFPCPLCGKRMRVGTVTKGAQTGKKFRVCFDYPSCRGLIPFSEAGIKAEIKAED